MGCIMLGVTVLEATGLYDNIHSGFDVENLSNFSTSEASKQLQNTLKSSAYNEYRTVKVHFFSR